MTAGLFVLLTITIQITDRVMNNAFDPAEYFSYFTIQSSLINIVVLTVGGAMALHYQRDTVLYTVARASVVAYAIVTAGVYNLLLRNVPYEGYQGLQWPNEVIHVWIPIVIAADWLFSPGRPALPWKAVWGVIVFPVAWLVYTLLRGVATTIYPYPFLDPANGGWGSVLAYIVGLTGFMLVIGLLAVTYSRRRARA